MKGIPGALVGAVMSQHESAKTEVKGGTHLSKEFEANDGVHQGTVLSPMLFVILIDVVANEVKEDMLH